MPRLVLEWEKRLGRRLTLRDLHILKTVARSGSMAKAARDLGMSQPSVSEAIAKLEAALRVRLLDRGPRGIEPTIYANALLRREQVVSDELQQGIRGIEFSCKSHCGRGADWVPRKPCVRLRPDHHLPYVAPLSEITFQVTPLEPAAMGFRELRERRVNLTVGRILHPRWTTTWMRKSYLRIDCALSLAPPWPRRRKIAMEELMHEPW